MFLDSGLRLGDLANLTLTTSISRRVANGNRSIGNISKPAGVVLGLPHVADSRGQPPL